MPTNNIIFYFMSSLDMCKTFVSSFILFFPSALNFKLRKTISLGIALDDEFVCCFTWRDNNYRMSQQQFKTISSSEMILTKVSLVLMETYVIWYDHYFYRLIYSCFSCSCGYEAVLMTSIHLLVLNRTPAWSFIYYEHDDDGTIAPKADN